jgi:hypothetical protein
MSSSSRYAPQNRSCMRRDQIEKGERGIFCLPCFSLVLEDDVQSVDDTGNVTQDGKQDVDPEISIASSLQEYSDWGNEDLKRREKKEKGETMLAGMK